MTELTYQQEYVTRRVVQDMMDRHTRTILDGVKELVKQLVIPNQQEKVAVAPSKCNSEEDSDTESNPLHDAKTLPKKRQYDGNVRSDLEYAGGTGFESDSERYRNHILLNEKEKEKEKSSKENSLLNLSEQLKIEFSWRDNQTNRKYKLTTNCKFEMFEDFLKSELRIKKLLYILEITSNELHSEQKVVDDKFKVRDIIINRIDTIYDNKIIDLTEPKEFLTKLKDVKQYESRTTTITARNDLSEMRYVPGKDKIIDLTEPKEILTKLKDVKRYESRTTTITARNDLSEMRYVPGKESASEFYDKFQEKVRVFEAIPDAEVEASKAGRAKVPAAKAFRDGHCKEACPHPGKHMCYYCKKLGSHVALDCNKRKADLESLEYSSTQLQQSKRGRWNFQRGNGSNAFRGRGCQSGNSNSGQPNTTKPYHQNSSRGARGGMSNRGRGRGLSDAVPEIVTANCLFKASTSKPMSCGQLKDYMLQVEASKPGRAKVPAAKAFHASGKQAGQARQICKLCGMDGHCKEACLHPGKRMCYYCKKLGSHVALDCNKRKADLKSSEYGSTQLQQFKRGRWNFQRGNGSNAFRGRRCQSGNSNSGQPNTTKPYHQNSSR
ncbi:hypothetical protein TSAR_015298 [Trichomalopsis sarcophagae]|uniref:CCHC-type domain-containing protein n=1 Tax=Trichomalopsis sarcophagae TaxID=543379 RepID=A0A232EDH1_9HYME|nr:hypothetical protein TSAR_015298 [Trichomalopsis sarcophagae]